MKSLPVLLSLLLAIPSVRAADNLNPELQRGLFEEEANQNFDAAIKAYQSVLSTHDNERKLAATALFRLGECYRKLGRTNDAVTQYQRLVTEFADQTTLANLSRQNLVGLGATSTPSRAGTSGEPDRLLEQVLAERQVEALQLNVTLKQLQNLNRLELRRVLPTIAPDSLLLGLMEELSKAELKMTTLSKTFTSNHPEVTAVRSLIQSLNDQIHERASGVLQGLKMKAEALSQQEEELKRKLATATRSTGQTGWPERTAPMADPTARAQLRELLQGEIKIAEQFAAEQRKKVEVGTLAPGDQVRFERDVLNLKRQLVAVDGLVSAEDRTQWRELLLQEIKLAEEAARLEKQKLDVGRSVASEVARLQRDVLILKRELVTFDADPARAAASAAGGANRASYAQRLQAVVHSPADGAGTDEEEKEIRRTQVLIKDSPDLINATETGGYRPLHRAASSGYLRVAEFLIANGADVNVPSLYNGLATGPTPLRAAAAAGHKKMVELLLSKGASVKASGTTTALHDAAAKGYKSIVEVLLANKADVNARDDKGATPLVYAVKNNHLAVAQLLLANKAETELKCTTYLSGATGALRDFAGQYPLHVAVRARHEGVVDLLLKNGANPNVRVDSKEQYDSPDATPLLLAVDYKLKSAVLALLQAKADPAISAADMRHSLHAAVVAPELLELLLDNQVSPDITNQTGATALHWAARNRNFDAAKILIKHGADINATDKVGYTPLHSAAQAGDPEMVRFLVANKANLNARNKDGDPPLELARRVSSSARYTIVEMLLQHGAMADLPRFDRIAVRRSATSSQELVFQKGGTNDWNRFTLLELLAVKYGLLSSSADGSSPGRNRDRADLFFINQMNHSRGLPFPDLERIVIRRPEPDGTQWKEIPAGIDRLSRPDGNDCPGNIPLAWGDVVEIPELDHLAADRWTGFDNAALMTLHRCLSRTIRVTVKGETTTIKLAPDLEFPPGSSPSLVTNRRYMLVPVLKESRLLRNTSDLSRVAVTRRSAAGQPVQKWVLDCSNNFPDLWLRDGDVIEVPEK